jgi:hypothetical protein
MSFPLPTTRRDRLADQYGKLATSPIALFLAALRVCTEALLRIERQALSVIAARVSLPAIQVSPSPWSRASSRQTSRSSANHRLDFRRPYQPTCYAWPRHELAPARYVCWGFYIAGCAEGGVTTDVKRCETC